MTHVSVLDFEANTADLLRRTRGGELNLKEDGVPLRRFTPIRVDAPLEENVSRRFGFLVGKGRVPENWNGIAQDDIEGHFGCL